MEAGEATRAREAYDDAGPPPASLGLPPQQKPEWVLRQICEQVKKAGKGMDQLPPGQSKPTPQQIETALESFTIRQWTPVERWPPLVLSPPMKDWPVKEYRYGLMESVGREEVEALLDHIRRNGHELKGKIDARKLEAIEGRAIERSTKLWLAENRSRLVPVSDVYWVWAWRALVREANVRGKGRPAKGRSLAEQGSARSIARRLTKRDKQTGREMKVTAYEVRQWGERMEKLPFEQFAADRGAADEKSRAAALIDYWTMIRNTAAYKKYLEAQHRREK